MPDLGPEEEQAAIEVLRSGFLSEGPRVAELEQTVARDLEQNHGVATACGTAALALCLRALGVEENSEVVIPSYACTSLLDAVKWAGCAPRVVDVAEKDLVMEVETVLEGIGPRTGAVVLVHNFGNPADLRGLTDVNAPVIEDLAQCIGGRRDGLRVGEVGDCSVLSFYATKMLTTGYGGMLVSSEEKLIARARDLREFDEREEYEPRFHVSLSDLNAAIGLAQWGKLPRFIEKRRQLARRYHEIAGKYAVDPQGEGVYFRYLIRAPQGAEDAISAFEERGVEAKRPIYRPIHCYLGLDPTDYPVAERAHREIVSVPLYPALSDEDVGVILDAMEEVLKG
ncbi:MAG: DegT/DnrJ/EryC1/StrS aminotransferase family protein [Planctomycetes bacterium]|nr:DegT/DnrJ/EryC1/StrS aminotransferase family protein [Planctomycetota bacterium]